MQVGSLRESATVEQGRIPALDVLRGIAILGTLATNIWVFTLSSRAMADADSWLARFAMWLPNGKFLGLLTIMFGIGLEIQRQSALRAGRKWPGKYPIRAGLLFADGVLNYVFVVQFDVLRAYAVVGVLVAFLLLSSERVQWWLAGIFMAVHFAVLAWQGFGSDDGTGANSAWQAEDLPGATSWWSEVMYNARSLGWSFGYGSEFLTILLMGLGLFLIGAKLYRHGIFTEAKRELRLSMIGAGFLVALPMQYLLGMTSILPPGAEPFGRYAAAPVVSLGILALVAEFYVRRPRLAMPGRLLSYIGRMALSCYLLQNILGVLAQRMVFSRAVFQRMDITVLTCGAFVAISATLLVFSWLWLRWQPRGPFEAAWNWCYRKLARE
ncbi:DUF418 domain-containing protein [Nocardia colli]|uniref:DUF418 domain-containing protein n=1 Tax=Nocardia colli TaxID=2545717 RepID=UPI0035DF3B19